MEKGSWGWLVRAWKPRKEQMSAVLWRCWWQRVNCGAPWKDKSGLARKEVKARVISC